MRFKTILFLAAEECLLIIVHAGANTLIGDSESWNVWDN